MPPVNEDDPAGPRPARPRREPAVLLSGGNPQIAKGYGEAPVQAYLDAMPGWKQEAGRRLDALITACVPAVRKAVKWNSPLYGAPGREDWFLSFHAITRYIKIAFHNGVELDPPLPVGSKQPKVRYLHFDEAEPFDEAAFTAWVKQAAALPGEKM